MKQTMCLLALLAATSIQCGRNETPLATHDESEHAEAPAATNEVRLSEPSREMGGIAVEEVKSQQTKDILEAMGKVLAPKPQTAIVGHAFSARVAEVHVKLGEWVEERQELVTLESHEVGAAKSELFKAIADLELAKLNFEREKQLLESEIGIEKNFRAAEAEYKIAQANEEAAHKRMHIFGFTDEQVKEIEETHQIQASITLYAPIAGKIVDNNAVLGALIDQATEIIRIIDPTLLWVDAQIYEKDISKVKIGQEVEIKVPAYPDEVFRGEVSYIGDEVNEETRTITVRAEVSNEESKLKPGMFADVDILLNGSAETLVVPKSAVLEDGRQKVVFVKVEDSFLLREVETDPANGEDYLRIRSGLDAGEEVVITGSHLLRSELKEDLLRQAHHHGHQH
ncbi:MAG: efflux RND transporter periplasmic adaptor subunit [Planctomycetes bacterium]|nr:efflux RND transporter periplasmic adaptor subunit [Planctomycetota bacterium]MBL7044266.1 efflux RND transporter periplasmic adaptor subunit [Pirellulaceae bacterium]